MLLLITNRIFILVRFFLGDAVAYIFLEMFLSFFQQFDRLVYVSRARFIGLFLDPLSILAPHDSVYVFDCLACCICHSVWLSSGKFDPPCWSHQLPVLLKKTLWTSVVASAIRTYICEHVTHFTGISATWHKLHVLKCTWGRSPAFQKLEEKL